MEIILRNTATILMIIGFLAFMVLVITQVTKNIGFLKKIPTDSQVIILSIALSISGYFAYLSYYHVAFYWYCLFGAILGSFVVAFIAMYGWSKLKDLFSRYVPLNKES